MKYPKKLTVQLPNIDYPSAILIHNNVSTPDSDKDFGLGELYVPSRTRINELSPRRDISPSIFNVSRQERRKHPSNFEPRDLLKMKTLEMRYNINQEKKVSIFNTSGIRTDPKELYRKAHPTKFNKETTWDLNGRKVIHKTRSTRNLSNLQIQ